MVVVLPDPEAALDVLESGNAWRPQVKAFEQALKVLEREIKTAFPDSAVHCRWWAIKLWCAARRRTSSRRRRSSASSREHAPTAKTQQWSSSQEAST